MRRAFALLLAACACGGEEPAPAADAGRASDGGAPAAAIDAALADLPGLPPYPPHVRSLRLRRSISVRAEPAAEAERLGTVARDTRVGVRSARAAPGCDGRWIEIEPRGWVCEEHLEPSTREPDGVELPRLARGELVPGVYGKLSREAKIVTWKDGALTGARALQGS
ncbi:MAG TPA: hypothetical protein VKZ63_03750, partial [Kofleriaceae bacterium]|nr:hypothetical protein [Kofleriaceae bacterium]